MLGEVLDLVIGQAAVGISNDAQTSAFIVTESKNAVAEDDGPPAKVLTAGDAVGGGRHADELHPGSSTAAGMIGAAGILCDETIISVDERLLEREIE